MGNIGNLNAKITADAQQFVSEFQRADNAARRSSYAIDVEVGRLAKSIKKKFSASDVGKDLLKGFGIGSGFAVAQQAAEVISGFWERAANAAKAIEESSQKAMEATLKGLTLRQNPEQQLASLEKDFRRKGEELAGAKTPQKITRRFRGREGEVREVVDELPVDQEKIHALTAEYNALGLAVDEARKKITDDAASKAAKLSDSDAERRAKGFEESLKKEEDAFDALIKKTHESNDETAKARKEAEELALKYREIADPALKYKNQIAEVNKLWADGKLNANEQADAIRNITAAMTDDEERRINADLADFYKELDEASDRNAKKIKANSLEIERIVGHSADAMADAWVDSINGVEGAWGDLGRTILREIERIVAQILIVKPLINSIGGFIGSTGFWGSVGTALSNYGGGKATGGGIEGGVTYRVNEQGQEFFKSDVGGTIIPAGMARGMGAGGKSGDTFFIDATGADPAAIARLESTIRTLNGSIERRSVAAVVTARRRGGGTAQALG